VTKDREHNKDLLEKYMEWSIYFGWHVESHGS